MNTPKIADIYISKSVKSDWSSELTAEFYKGSKLENLALQTLDIVLPISPMAYYNIEVLTEDNISGLWGPITSDIGTEIESIKDTIVGLNLDCLAIKDSWNKLKGVWRHSSEKSRLIGAIDCALWDLRSKVLNIPIYILLNGISHNRVNCYCSLINLNIDLPQAVVIAKQVLKNNFIGQKWKLPDGPNSGIEGLRRNVERIKLIREAVGPYHLLIFDVDCNWDIPYYLNLVNNIDNPGVTWIEEPLPNGSVYRYNNIEKGKGNIAVGEHCYNIESLLYLFSLDIVSMIQPDIVWAGGITPCKVLFDIASIHDKILAPHGFSFIPALHLSAPFRNRTILLEYNLILEAERQSAFRQRIIPKDGAIIYDSNEFHGLWMI